MSHSLKNLSDNCVFCNHRHLKIFMYKKYNSYICSACKRQCESYGNNIADYSINDLRKGLQLKRNISQIRKEENIQKQYIEFIKTIKFLTPSISSDKIHKKYLKDFPQITYKTIRKNTKPDKLNDFIVIDTETTGLKPAQDELLEISAIKYINQEPIECLTTLIKPKKIISNSITNINHIDNNLVKNSPNIKEVINSFSNFISGYNLVGYNIDFDLKFLHVNGLELFNEKREFYDVLIMCRKYFSGCGLTNYKLDTICDFYNIYRPQAHRATEDALATGQLFIDIGKKITNS